MSFFRRLFGFAGRNLSEQKPHHRSVIAQSVAKTLEPSIRQCRIESMESRRVLSASPLLVGAVYIEGDGGTDAEPDQFYIAYEGGSPTTSISRIVIDGNQDGSPELGSTDVYFDVIANDAVGNQAGVGGAHGFEWSNASTGVSAGEVTATVVDGGTRLILDLENFEVGDVLAFTIDVDQFFSSKPDDQVTSGIEFAGSKLEVTAYDSDYTFAPDPAVTDATFEYSFDFGSDAIEDTGLLSQLPSQFNRTEENGFNSIENRTAGALQELELIPRPVSLSGHVGLSDENGNCVDPDSVDYRGVEGVIITAENLTGDLFTTTTDSDGFYQFVDLPHGTYTVTQTQPSGLLDGAESLGTVEGITTGLISGNDQFSTIVLAPGDVGANYNFCEHEPSAIGGTVYYDRNDDGVQDAGEPGIGGVTIQLFDATGTLIDSTSTDQNGEYLFERLMAGTYAVREIQPSAYLDGKDSVGTINGVPTGTGSNDRFSNIVLGSGQQGVEYNFGEHLPSSIGGTVYYDQNDNGIQDNGEFGIAGVSLQLRDDAGNLVATTTDANGDYLFDRLMSGTYSVIETQPNAYLDGQDAVGTVNGVITGSGTNDRVNNIVLGSGQQGVEYNFGELRAASIEGVVMTDLNGDCQLDPELGERPVENVVIQLLDSSQDVVQEVRTDADGRYRFDGLRPGTYSVRQIQPGSLFTVGESIGTFNVTGSAGDGVTTENLISDITILSGAQLVDYNFCEAPAATISGFVFQDGSAISLQEGDTLTDEQAVQLRDGQLSNDDTRLAGVVLELRNGITGLPIDASQALPGLYGDGPIQTVTDANGFYEFTGLRQGNYAVFQIQPDGFRDHIDSEGTNQGIAINPTDSIDPFVLATLADGVDPANDAIMRIALNWGDNAEFNNFSEIATNIVPVSDPPPSNPPFDNPPSTPRTGTGLFGPNFVIGGLVRGSSGASPSVDIGGLSAPPAGSLGYTWHLSVINAGSPRGLQEAQTQWQNISFLTESNWSSVDMSRGVWQISQQNVADIDGVAETSEFVFGTENGIPMAGDFNGDGTDELLIYSGGYWYVDMNGNMKWDRDDLWAELGSDSDLPVVGDWDGDGKDDIGVYGPQWANDLQSIDLEPGLPDLSNDLTGETKNMPPRDEDASDGKRTMKYRANGQPRQDVIDHVFRFGSREELPVTGDWNGDGIRNIGTFQNGNWKLDVDGDGRLTSQDQTIQFGQTGDLPVVGDFDGNGVEQIGVFRNGTWIVDSNGNGVLDVTDKVFELGGRGDIPVVGDFDGDGVDEPAVYQKRTDPLNTADSGQRKAG